MLIFKIPNGQYQCHMAESCTPQTSTNYRFLATQQEPCKIVYLLRKILANVLENGTLTPTTNDNTERAKDQVKVQMVCQIRTVCVQCYYCIDTPNVVPHTYTGVIHTANVISHAYNAIAHIYNAIAHNVIAHPYNVIAHTYSVTAHTYSVTAHTYSVTAHTYSVTAHTYSVTAHTYNVIAHSYYVISLTHNVIAHVYNDIAHTFNIAHTYTVLKMTTLQQTSEATEK